MIRAVVLGCVLSAGCGRVGFDLLAGAGDDVAGDAGDDQDAIGDGASGSGFMFDDFTTCPPSSCASTSLLPIRLRMAKAW